MGYKLRAYWLIGTYDYSGCSRDGPIAVEEMNGSNGLKI